MVHTSPCHTFNAAIVRTPSSSVVHGLRGRNIGDPDYQGVVAEHRAYVRVLESLGMKVTVLPRLEKYPDSIFVEDPALVFRQGAILLRPGAPTRRGEAQAILPALHEHFEQVLELPDPGSVEGGDVLVTPGTVFIGLSKRTNKAGAEALIQCLGKLGLKGRPAQTPADTLHFKSDCSLLDQETILCTRRLDQSGVFNGFRTLIVPDGEEPAANALRINDHVLASANHLRTLEMLDKAGYALLSVKTTEIQKIDAGLSCMSLRWFRG